MATKLSWKANIKKRCSKAWKAFYFLKRNISNLASQTKKLNAYVGYVIPVISYASQAWFANKTESKGIERIQRKATSWIISNWEISYKQRLSTLKLLPLSYYFELHDLLMLISLLKGSYNIKIPIKTNNNEGLLSTRQNELITINKTRTRKADENFWKKTSYLLNIIRKIGNVDLDQIDKKYLTKIYWNYFFKSYSEVNLCSWAFNCSCGHCNPVQKLSSVVIWRVQTHVERPTEAKTLSLSLSLSLLATMWEVSWAPEEDSTLQILFQWTHLKFFVYAKPGLTVIVKMGNFSYLIITSLEVKEIMEESSLDVAFQFTSKKWHSLITWTSAAAVSLRFASPVKTLLLFCVSKILHANKITSGPPPSLVLFLAHFLL